MTKSERAELLTLADMLRTTQLQANAINATSHQMGVYGDIGKVLFDVLVMLTGDEPSAFEVTDALVDSGEDVTYCMSQLHDRIIESAEKFAV